jgi:hypothetical protein
MSGSGGNNMASGSTTDDVSEVRREIEALFRWNPPTLILPRLPKKKYTTKTRPPAFYDKHFDDRLILQRVARLPSLVQALATNVDQKLSAASETLPSKPLGMSARQQYDRTFLPTAAPDEKAVALYYDKTTAEYCHMIASALIFHCTVPMPDWLPLLSWTQSVHSSGYAIMDGQLVVNTEESVNEGLKAAFRGILKSMDPDIRQMYERMKGPPLMSLASWEFKGLATGSDAVMEAVRNLDKFSWTYCEDPNCKTLNKHKALRHEIAETKIGPDAQNPPWNLNASLFTSNFTDYS